MKTQEFNLIIMVLVLVLIILAIINLISLRRLKNNYKKLMEVLGKGNNFNDMLKNYVMEVEDASKEIERLKSKTDSLQKNVEKCFQKIGIVRYNAFSETGGSLSFALALLDFENKWCLFER